MNGQEFNTALTTGKRVYGTMIFSPAPEWLPQVTKLGLDFIFIDTEHVAGDPSTLSWMCRAYSAAGLAPIVRIPAPDPYQASQVLDAGAAGVIAPYVESAEQVKQLAGAVKYKPIKGQKLASILSGETAAEPLLENYIQQKNAGRSLIINIESVPAMENLDDILKVPGLDAVLIGPHDLSCNLGLPEEYTHPEFDQAVREILRKTRASGIGAGVHYICGDIEQEIRWIKEERANVILHSADLLAFVSGIRQDISSLKGALGDSSSIVEGPAALIV